MKLNRKVMIYGMADAGMNNKQLAEASGISISRISNIKNGANTTFEMAEKISKVLDVNVWELISEEKEKDYTLVTLLNDLQDRVDGLAEGIIAENGLSVSRAYKQGLKDAYCYVLNLLRDEDDVSKGLPM